jgi:hypothetical protein
MTEQEWRKSAGPVAMFTFLQGIDRFHRKRILSLALVWEARMGDLPNPLLHEAAINLGNHTIEEDLKDDVLCGVVAARACGMALTYLDARLPNYPDAESRITQGLRDIFGPLLFRPIVLDPAWRSSDVLSLAQAIYDERMGHRTPMLGDALEDAGCTNAEIMNHCRQPGVHVRGCWVVDCLLEKE